MVSSLIFQKFSGEGLTEPPPQTPPPPAFFSGFAFGLGFALNSRALRALDSGFALDTRALRALDSDFALITFDLGPWFGPPNKSLDPPLMPNVPNALVAEAPLQTPLGSLRCSPNPLIVGFEKKLCSGGCFYDSGGECLHDPGGIDAPANRDSGFLSNRDSGLECIDSA